jgi:hypothetical protein
MDAQFLEFIIDNNFETIQDAKLFYDTFGPQEIDDNIDSLKLSIDILVGELDSRGSLDQALTIINKKCLYNNYLAQYAAARIHSIRFERFRLSLVQNERDEEMATLLKMAA